MTRLVRELMRPGVVTCKPQATLGQVARILTENRVHALFVVGADGKIKGIITDFDLLAGEWLSGDPEGLAAMRRMTAGDLMSSPVNSIEASAPSKEAAQRMQERVVRRLLVTENGKPVGVISVSDIVASIAEKAITKRETVADVMSDAFLTCRDQTPLASAARAMTSSGWRSVLVVDANGKPLGVVSGLDLLPYCDSEGDCGKVLVDVVMHPAITIHMNATLQEAARKLIENHHHRLVVIDPAQPDAVPLGIISSSDIVAEMARPESIWQK
jgi:CBS domain-containing protein